MSHQKATLETRLVITMEWNSALVTATMIIGQEIHALQHMELEVVSGSIVANASEQITSMLPLPMVIRTVKVIGYAGMPGMGITIH